MGNYLYADVQDLFNQISKYKAGDIEEFMRLADLGKHTADIRFRAWKIACLYYYMVNLPESMHDLGISQPSIIAAYEELASSEDPTVQQFVNLGMPKVINA